MPSGSLVIVTVFATLGKAVENAWRDGQSVDDRPHVTFCGAECEYDVEVRTSAIEDDAAAVDRQSESAEVLECRGTHSLGIICRETREDGRSARWVKIVERSECS